MMLKIDGKIRSIHSKARRDGIGLHEQAGSKME
jgi:hypothetical protein